MLHRTLPLVGVILAACTPTEEPSKPPAAPVVASTLEAQPTASVDAERLLGNIRKLASDDFGGRAPMSDGEVKTLQFLEEKFRQFGLQPLFGDSYRQSVDLVSIDPNPETVQMTFSLKGNDRLVTYRDEMVAVTLRVVPESRVEASEVVFVGYGIVAPEYGWDDYADVDVSGKTVLILVNDPGYATGDADLFKGKKMTYYGRWTYKYEEAANQGAAAAIIVHDTAPAAYGWDVVRNSWTGPQFHLATENDNIDRVAIESWVQKFIAEELAQASGTSLTKLMAAALSPEFQAVALAATMSASVQNELIRSQSYNIGALIPGSEAPEELFIYIAHWDHLGTAKPTNPAENSSEDLIYNGAVDNASGTAALIELAYSFAQLETLPKRSVAFLAVTAEESGLLGSAWYASNPPIPMAQTVGGINMDALNPYGTTNDIMVVGYGSSEMEDLLIQAASAQNRVIKPEDHPERGYYYRSDHFNFAKKGVPMLYAESGTDHRELGPAYLEGRGKEYVETRYHSPADEVQDDWDLRGIVEGIELNFSIGHKVVNSGDWPEWYEGNEFRAIREDSRKPSHQ